MPGGWSNPPPHEPRPVSLPGPAANRCRVGRARGLPAPRGWGQPGRSLGTGSPFPAGSPRRSLSAGLPYPDPRRGQPRPVSGQEGPEPTSRGSQQPLKGVSGGPPGYIHRRAAPPGPTSGLSGAASSGKGPGRAGSLGVAPLPSSREEPPGGAPRPCRLGARPGKRGRCRFKYANEPGGGRGAGARRRARQPIRAEPPFRSAPRPGPRRPRPSSAGGSLGGGGGRGRCAMRRSAEGQCAPPAPLAPGLSRTEGEGDPAAPKGGGEEARRGIHARPLLPACLLRRQCGERREGPLVLGRLVPALPDPPHRLPCLRCRGGGWIWRPRSLSGGGCRFPPRAPLSCWGRPRPSGADLPPASLALRGGHIAAPVPGSGLGGGRGRPERGGCFGVPGSPARLRGGLPLQVPRQELGRGSCAELPGHLWESPVGL